MVRRKRDEALMLEEAKRKNKLYWLIFYACFTAKFNGNFNIKAVYLLI